jgi:HAD superfamily hydrolase (TIGR01509 family)
LRGAVETIEAIAAHGVPQVCVSNSSRRIVDANIQALGISRHVAFSISLDDVERGKPDPQGYATACHRLGLKPNSVAAVEDSPTGASAARAAGLVVVGYGPSAGGFEDVDHAIDEIPRLLRIAGVPELAASEALRAARR